VRHLIYLRPTSPLLTRYIIILLDLATDFASLNLDVSTLAPHWWVPEPLRADETVVKVPTTHEEVVVLRETKAQVDARIRTFLQNVAKLPYDHIAVVGHSYFFKRMLGMGRKLANCELAVVSLQELAARHDVPMELPVPDKT
jgi:hypothetical protein